MVHAWLLVNAKSLCIAHPALSVGPTERLDLAALDTSSRRTRPGPPQHDADGRLHWNRFNQARVVVRRAVDPRRDWIGDRDVGCERPNPGGSFTST